MASKSSFDATAIKIFNNFGDLIEDATYVITGAWNPVTETSSDTNETIRMSVRAINREEPDGGVMEGDLMATIIQSEMTATPKIDDRIAFNAVNYLVRSVADNHSILWQLELRRV